jgi:signal recognition particle subunit SRP54
MSGNFNLEDIYSQIEQMQKLGPINKVMEMLPFGAKIPKDAMQAQEGKLKKFKVAMDSMTDDELKDPDLIKHDRIERIAAGAGVKADEVKELLAYYKRMKKMMKNMGNERKMRKLVEKFGGTGAGIGV